MAIRGTSAAQDGRYFAQDKKLLASMTFPACFKQRVDMKNVQRDVINQWVTERLTQLLGFEDDIVASMAINLLEPAVDETLDPKQLQMALTGFLAKQAGAFTEELWQLLLDAQSSPTGIPRVLLEKKQQEMQVIAQEKERLKQVLEMKREGVKESDGDAGRGRTREKATAAEEMKVRRSPIGGLDRLRRDARQSSNLKRRRGSPVLRLRRSMSADRHSTSRHSRRRSRSARPRSPNRRQQRRSRSSLRGRSRRERSRSLSADRRRTRRKVVNESRSCLTRVWETFLLTDAICGA